MSGRVAWIHVAPIKALGIAAIERVTLTERGIEDDRRFCVVDDEGRMLNAKRVPMFVAVRPRFDDGALELRLPDGAVVRGPVELGETLTVSIYRRRTPAQLVRGPFADTLSSLARRPVRLVRFVEPGGGVDRGLEAGATLLSVAALDALAEAARTDGPVDPRRFRMTFGVAGVPAHAEDGWIGRRVRLGGATVVPEGNVGRCAVTTLDPGSAVSDLDTLDALARYRGALRTTEPLPFGVWARVEAAGVVCVGDDVVVSEVSSPNGH